MKRLLYLTIISILLAALTPAALAADAPANSAHSAILLHADTGAVLFEQRADEEMLIASTTKIMTALVTLESCLTDEKVSITDDCCGIEGSTMYLTPGTTRSVSELLYGLMLASGNDAAVALACHVGGSIDGFAGMMNDKARELGLENSSFKNPHGLDEEGHYSSARDLAVIMAEAMKNESFVKIASTKSIAIGGLTFANHNKLLWNYAGTLGGKTGYTMAAGRTLVSCAERDGLRLVCVTLSDPNDWDDHMRLYDWGFKSYSYENVLPDGEVARLPVISGGMESVGVVPEREQRLLLRTGDLVDIIYELPRFTYAEIAAGEHAGAALVKVNGEDVARIDLCYNSGTAIPEGEKLTRWEKFKRTWYLANRYSGLQYGYYSML